MRKPTESLSIFRKWQIALATFQLVVYEGWRKERGRKGLHWNLSRCGWNGKNKRRWNQKTLARILLNVPEHLGSSPGLSHMQPSGEGVSPNGKGECFGNVSEMRTLRSTQYTVSHGKVGSLASCPIKIKITCMFSVYEQNLLLHKRPPQRRPVGLS